LFNWFGTFWKIPDTYALQHQSLDAYLFLRYLRVCASIAFVGACITWPILFPINATGGGGKEQLNLLSFSNLDSNTSAGRHRMYAHVFVGWIYFSFILVMVCRETIYFINLRQAFLLSPIFANRISSRTVLFTSVPSPYLDEAKLRKVFGDGVKHIWITRDTKKVEDLVKERDKVAFKLEAAETKLIKLANVERTKAIKKGANAEEHPVIANGDAESGSIAARWIPPKKRPTHRTGKFGLIGPKVDSINWCREELERLIPETEAAQASYLAGEATATPSVFIEFDRQSEAQAAYQTLSHHQALHMSPRYIGVHPAEVVWSSLKISWWQKVVRRYAVQAFICALILFWAIPVAAVGLISNVPQLETLSWLSWLQKIPDKLMGIVSGLLPSVLLAILMSLVPIIMRRKSIFLASMVSADLVDSLRETRRRTNSCKSRTLYAKRILCFPGHSGLPCRDLGIRSFGSRSTNCERSRIHTISFGVQVTIGGQFLHFILHSPGLDHLLWSPLASCRFHHLHSCLQVPGFLAKKHVSEVDQSGCHFLGKRFASLRQYCGHW
jgi:hypothetical protein